MKALPGLLKRAAWLRALPALAVLEPTWIGG